MVKKPLPEYGDCPVSTTVSLLSSKWKLLIIRDLLAGPQRYSELKKSIIGISQKMLTESLRELEADGLVERTVYPEVPPKVIYNLSELGDTLRSVIDALADWGDMYIELLEKKESK
ncbi:winged helix-turn-helix transcriptional regulator [Lactobacillus sp. AN1001]